MPKRKQDNKIEKRGLYFSKEFFSINPLNTDSSAKPINKPRKMKAGTSTQ